MTAAERDRRALLARNAERGRRAVEARDAETARLAAAADASDPAAARVTPASVGGTRYATVDCVEPACPHCGNWRVKSRAKRRKEHGAGFIRYIECGACGRTYRLRSFAADFL